MNNKYSDLINKQYECFQSMKTRSLSFRIQALEKLFDAIQKNESEITDALNRDLGKGETESYLTEIGPTYAEIRDHIKNLKKWSKPKKVKTPITLFPGKSYTTYEPYGNTLIISPWNYPFQLAIIPLIGAISGGNTAIIKPSEISPNTSEVLRKIINSTFEEDYIKVVLGDVDDTNELLKERFDLIFFTGSSNVGKIIMNKASANLTPVVLELGGKSPVIIDKDCNISLSAKRVAFGKVMNAGQTCVAPDYILIHENRYYEFVAEFKKNLETFFDISDYMDENRNITDYPGLCKIISEKHYKRAVEMLSGEDVILGGRYDDNTNKIEPTLINSGYINDYLSENNSISKVMEEEIFSPLLPIIRYNDINDCIKYIKKNEKPLSLYVFSSNQEVISKITNSISYGGGCINDTLIQLANPNLPFGGVGNSGMGKYHGKFSFYAFSHEKSIFKNSTIIDLAVRYLPYTKLKLKLLKKIIK